MNKKEESSSIVGIGNFDIKRDYKMENGSLKLSRHNINNFYSDLTYYTQVWSIIDKYSTKGLISMHWKWCNRNEYPKINKICRKFENSIFAKLKEDDGRRGCK